MDLFESVKPLLEQLAKKFNVKHPYYSVSVEQTSHRPKKEYGVYFSFDRGPGESVSFTGPSVKDVVGQINKYLSTNDKTTHEIARREREIEANREIIKFHEKVVRELKDKK